MDSSRLRALVQGCCLLLLVINAVYAQDDTSDLETRALRDFYPKDAIPSSEKELVSSQSMETPIGCHPAASCTSTLNVLAPM